MTALPQKPPRCLRPFQALDWKKQLADLPRSDFRAYSIHCPCGGTVLKVHALLLTDINELDYNLSIECASCQKLAPLFDMTRDGYNAEIGDLPLAREKFEKIIWNCPQCKSSDGALVAAFGYQYDMSDMTAEEALHAEDFFDAFILWHQCLNSPHLELVSGVECA